MRKLVLRALGVIFTLFFPAFLVLTNVRLAANEIRLYEYGFEKYGVSKVTGLPEGQLMVAAQGLIAYFNSSDELMQVRVEKDGRSMYLFNQREIGHLRDVKALFQVVGRVQFLALAYMLGYAALSLLWARGHFGRILAEKIAWGSLLAVGLVLFLGLGVLLDFDRLFLQFHLFSFSNDLWLLDPRRDYLIMMFPQGFWFDAALAVGGATLLEGAVLGGVAWGYLGYLKKASLSGN